MKPTRHDPAQTQAQTQAQMRRWLQERCPAWENLIVSGLVQAEAGMSSELLMFDVAYEKDGADCSGGVVIRLEPSADHQLFLDTAFEEQYRAMAALFEHSKAPIPRPLGFESESDLLGSRFYAMSRSTGRTGALWLDWMAAIGDDRRERTWWNGLEAMAELHRVDPEQAGLRFLDQPTRGSDPIDQLLQYNWEYYVWVRGGERRPIIEVAYEWLRRNKPCPLPPVGFAWGDAKRGNLLYSEHLECTAVLDFEMLGLGPAEMDLAYWIEGEHQTAEMLGMRSPTISDTVDRYSTLLGREITDLSYYIILAAFRIAVLRVKLWILREGEELRGDPYDGDARLALILQRYAGVDAGPVAPAVRQAKGQ